MKVSGLFEDGMMGDAYDDNFDGDESDDDEFHTGSRMLFKKTDKVG